jgi:hypothetical protein
MIQTRKPAAKQDIFMNPTLSCRTEDDVPGNDQKKMRKVEHVLAVAPSLSPKWEGESNIYKIKHQTPS